MKIFVMERVATWLLSRDSTFRALARDPFAARSRIYKLPLAVICDALKIAYATQGREQYKDVFRMVQEDSTGSTRIFRYASAGGWACPGLGPRSARSKSYWQSGAR